LAALAVLAVIGALTGLPSPRADAVTLAAVFPPWWTQVRIWRAAVSAGDVADIGGLRFVLVLHARNAVLAAQLRHAGALLILDPRSLGACSVASKAFRS
jgi:hypothetical protein